MHAAFPVCCFILNVQVDKFDDKLLTSLSVTILVS